MKPISVTKIRIAFECPRLFYLGHKYGGKMLFIPPNTVLGLGQAFHELSETIVHTLKREQKFTFLLNKNLNLETTHKQIQSLLYELVFLPYLHSVKHHSPEKLDQLYPLWLGLTPFIYRLSELLVKNSQYCPSEEVIKKTLITQEYKLEYWFTLPNNRQQLVTGKLDSLLFNFAQNRLSVVEYKTYHPVDPTAQLAQVALYSYMLSYNKSLPINALVYCVLPNFKEYDYSWEILEQNVYQLIPYKLQQMQTWLQWKKGQPSPPPPTSQPHLCQICSQKIKCQKVFNTYFL
ncbi:conserved hypothetical protein [Gloeothece citriformis PCC 7424]|uniref:PD-(D/E)XK endonuclease-like domain-containing protein n=1 Tax=Gloeothece citriformis (strain PCC 7424) TaxID=65393 RepID=B7KH02_GLOC7|nr:PD-(D/E)XK nuclease family protein [Gloeothece citriformis]ACK73489.1 conserved hypothetical protein [Gloeothece citriformis PCC 7424]